MKTTLDLPDKLLRETKAAAALKGQSMKVFITRALEERIRQMRRGPERRGWRSVFGKARRSEVEKVNAIIEQEFSRIDEESWR